MKKILLITTGGTIASISTPKGLKPGLDGKHLLNYLPELSEFCEVDIESLFAIDSTNIYYKHWLKIAKTIKDKKKKRELLKPTVIRKKKHRLLGGLVGSVNGFVMSLFLCVPIAGVFSIASTINETAKSLDGVDVDSDVKEALEFSDVYDQTWMAKLFDKFGDNGLDEDMFDKLFTIDVSGQEKIKIRGEVNSLANFATQTSNTGILDLDFDNMEVEDVHSIKVEYIAEAFKTLGDLHLLDVAYNVGVDFLEYSDFISEHEVIGDLYINYEDLRTIKLSQDILNLGKVIEDSVDILSSMEPGKEFNYKNLDEEQLAKLVEDLFNIELLNIGINTGLSYVLELDEVVEFVGDNQVNYENIDWKKVKADGVQFAILRSVRRSGNVDKQLASNIKGCLDNGIPFEFYKYTYATTEVAVRNEAKEVANALVKLGVPKGSRVWYDLEEDSLLNRGKAHMTKLYVAWKDELEKHGFVTGLYMGMYDYNNFVNKADFKNETKWIARYYLGYKELAFGFEPSLTYRPTADCDGWQFTSSGVVKGVSGRLDMNIFYGNIVVPNVAPEYYQTPEFTLIDNLNKIGVDSSYKNRAKIAQVNNITGYCGSAEQNRYMLQLLREGKLIQAK